MEKETKNWWEKLFDVLNSIHPVLFIFVILCCYFLSFVSMNNEEQYLLYAHQNYNPNWIPGSFIATEFPGNRLLFEVLFGWLVDAVGFEKTVFIGRIINFILLAIPLAGLFRLLKIKNVITLLILQFFILLDQTFYAGEWIFGSIESKTFAYIFVFWALAEFLKNRLYRSVLLIVVATYFHVLIGGWFAISCFGVLLLRNIHPKFSLKNILSEMPKLGLLYVIPLIPLLYYLATNLLINAPKIIDGVNLDYIYVYFRNKHHIGLFYSFDYFFKTHLIKVLMAIFAFIFLFRKKYTKEEVFFDTLKNLMLVMLGIGFFFLGVSLIDNVFFDLSGGFLLKSYPFRMQSMAFFIFIILIFYETQKKYANEVDKQKIIAIGTVVSFVAMMGAGGLNIYKMVNYQTNEPYNEVIGFITKNTQKIDAIMIVENKGGFLKSGGRNNQFGLDLIRRTERDNFVHFKFVPGGTVKLYEWYQRLQAVEKVEATPEYIGEVKKQFKVDYVLTPHNFDMPLRIIFENEKYRLYDIEN